MRSLRKTRQPKRTGPAADRIILPSKDYVFRPLVFDQAIPGGIEDLHVLVGDREARLLAASPRVYVVESPGDVVGKSKLQVKRGSQVVAEGKFRNNRPSSGNPWPYVIGVVVIVGIFLAVAAAKLSHDLGNLHFGPLAP